MTANLTYQAHQSHLDDLHRRAAEARRANGAGRVARRPLLAGRLLTGGRRRASRATRPAAERA